MTATVVATSRRGSGAQFGRPAVPVVTLSPLAKRLHLHTAEDVEQEYLNARRNWSVGSAYHCPFCDRDFWSASGARKHMRVHNHRVLRVDYYPEAQRP